MLDMAEEGMVGNVKQKNEKRIKAKSKKDKMSDDGAMPLQEVQNDDKMSAIESVRIIGKDDSDVMRERRRGQKKNKNNGTGDAEADISKESNESEFTDVNSKKKKKKSLENENKNAELESTTEEAKGNENKKWTEGEGVSGKRSYKNVDKEWKKQKVKTNDEDVDLQKGEKDGEVIETHGENCEIVATEMISRKKKKKEKKKNKHDNVVWPQGTCDEVKPDKGDSSALQQENMLENVGDPDDVQATMSDVIATKESERKIKKKHKKKEKMLENVGDPDDVQATMSDVIATKESERKIKKKHKKKEIYKDDSSSALQDSVGNNFSPLTHAKKRQNDEGKRKEEKTTFVENVSLDRQDNENADRGKKRKITLEENGSSDATPTKSNKKVRFSGEVEVFPLPDDSNTEKGNDVDVNVVKGKRFTAEENEILRNAVLNYIEEHELGDEGLSMILNSKKHPKLRGCWKEIASAIPYRPVESVYCRARIIFMRSESRKWTQEEYDMVLKHYEEHGNQWRALADELGKHPWHVKDTYRRIKLLNRKKGNWSQEEYQRLFNLVNTDLQLKISEEKKSKHGMLRDNICWSAISDELSTRNQATCCLKWYKQLTSPMVAQGVWSDSDDYRMLTALYSLDATCVEDVEWDDLIENRSGAVCRKRWQQMVIHIGNYRNKSFADQVEVLAQRYCPHLLEAREIWDNKPRVP